MARNMDAQILMTIMKKVVEQIIAKATSFVPSAQPECKEVDIVEYYGRMMAMNLNDFNSSIYIAMINYYLSQADKAHNRTKGALVLYVDTENAGRLFRALGLSIPDDEDDDSMLNACGELCKLIAEAFNNELTKLGYVNLVMSDPQFYKNSLADGVEFSMDQKKKYQCNFFYWKRKALALELTLAYIPSK